MQDKRTSNPGQEMPPAASGKMEKIWKGAACTFIAYQFARDRGGGMCFPLLVLELVCCPFARTISIRRVSLSESLHWQYSSDLKLASRLTDTLLLQHLGCPTVRAVTFFAWAAMASHFVTMPWKFIIAALDMGNDGPRLRRVLAKTRSHHYKPVGAQCFWIHVTHATELPRSGNATSDRAD